MSRCMDNARRGVLLLRAALLKSDHFSILEVLSPAGECRKVGKRADQKRLHLKLENCD